MVCFNKVFISRVSKSQHEDICAFLRYHLLRIELSTCVCHRWYTLKTRVKKSLQLLDQSWQITSTILPDNPLKPHQTTASSDKSSDMPWQSLTNVDKLCDKFMIRPTILPSQPTTTILKLYPTSPFLRV